MLEYKDLLTLAGRALAPWLVHPAVMGRIKSMWWFKKRETEQQLLERVMNSSDDESSSRSALTAELDRRKKLAEEGAAAQLWQKLDDKELLRQLRHLEEAHANPNLDQSTYALALKLARQERARRDGPKMAELERETNNESKMEAGSPPEFSQLKYLTECNDRQAKRLVEGGVERDKLKAKIAEMEVAMKGIGDRLGASPDWERMYHERGKEIQELRDVLSDVNKECDGLLAKVEGLESTSPEQLAKIEGLEFAAGKDSQMIAGLKAQLDLAKGQRHESWTDVEKENVKLKSELELVKYQRDANSQGWDKANKELNRLGRGGDVEKENAKLKAERDNKERDQLRQQLVALKGEIALVRASLTKALKELDDAKKDYAALNKRTLTGFSEGDKKELEDRLVKAAKTIADWQHICKQAEQREKDGELKLAKASMWLDKREKEMAEIVDGLKQHLADRMAKTREIHDPGTKVLVLTNGDSMEGVVEMVHLSAKDTQYTVRWFYQGSLQRGMLPEDQLERVDGLGPKVAKPLPASEPLPPRAGPTVENEEEIVTLSGDVSASVNCRCTVAPVLQKAEPPDYAGGCYPEPEPVPCKFCSAEDCRVDHANDSSAKSWMEARWSDKFIDECIDKCTDHGSGARAYAQQEKDRRDKLKCAAKKYDGCQGERGDFSLTSIDSNRTLCSGCQRRGLHFDGQGNIVGPVDPQGAYKCVKCSAAVKGSGALMHRATERRLCEACYSKGYRFDDGRQPVLTVQNLPLPVVHSDFTFSYSPNAGRKCPTCGKTIFYTLADGRFRCETCQSNPLTS